MLEIGLAQSLTIKKAVREHRIKGVHREQAIAHVSDNFHGCTSARENNNFERRLNSCAIVRPCGILSGNFVIGFGFGSGHGEMQALGSLEDLGVEGARPHRKETDEGVGLLYLRCTDKVHTQVQKNARYIL